MLIDCSVLLRSGRGTNTNFHSHLPGYRSFAKGCIEQPTVERYIYQPTSAGECLTPHRAVDRTAIARVVESDSRPPANVVQPRSVCNAVWPWPAPATMSIWPAPCPPPVTPPKVVISKIHEACLPQLGSFIKELLTCQSAPLRQTCLI